MFSSSFKNKIEAKNNALAQKLSKLQQSEKSELAELRKKIRSLEGNYKLAMSEKQNIDQSKGTSSSVVEESPIQDEQHSYFYRLIHKII